MPLNEYLFQPTGTVQDSVIASSLITAPAWGSWLNELNGILTTLSLLIGMLIGLHRLWRIFISSNKKQKKTRMQNNRTY